MKTSAIVLAAGNGKRMGGAVKKQFIDVCGRPLLYYSLHVFEESFVDEVVLVCSAEDMEYIKNDIVDAYGFSKINSIVPGGKERYDSVLCALEAIKECDFVFIHDGARPMIDSDILKRGLEAVKEYGACVIGMPSKDTVKLSDERGMIGSTPNRNKVWNIQTPQIFRFDTIKNAYEAVIGNKAQYEERGIGITDDAMVLELYCNADIKLVEGSYENIKVTTPGDIVYVESLLKMRMI